MSTDAQDTASTPTRIRRAAEEILAEGGYEALSMRKIASRIGLSQAAIYRHYKDKDELVGTIVAAGYAELVALVERLNEKGGSPAEILAHTVRAYVGWAEERPELFKALLLREVRPASAGVAGLAPGVARRRRTFGLLADLLARGMEEGLFARADPELTAQAVWTSIFGLAARLVLEGELPREHREALIERQVNIIVRGLSP